MLSTAVELLLLALLFPSLPATDSPDSKELLLALLFPSLPATDSPDSEELPKENRGMLCGRVGGSVAGLWSL